MRIIIIFLILFPSLCFAEPTDSVMYLMQEKLSLFDSGMIELNKTVEGFCEFYKDIIESWWPERSKVYVTTGLATYTWDDNRISISILIFLDKKDVEEIKLKDFSKLMFEALQTHFTIDKNTGQPINPIFDKTIELFSHQGYQRKSEPPTLQRDLHNIVYFNISYGTSPTDIFFKAHGKLYSNELLFSK